MTSAAAGLGSAIEVRATDVSPVSPRPAVSPERPASCGRSARSRQSSSSQGAATFEDQLEESLAGTGDEADDYSTVTDGCAAMRAAPSDEGKAAQTDQSPGRDEEQQIVADAPVPDSAPACCIDPTITIPLPVALAPITDGDASDVSGSDAAAPVHSSEADGAAAMDGTSPATPASSESGVETPNTARVSDRRSTSPALDVGEADPSISAPPAGSAAGAAAQRSTPTTPIDASESSSAATASLMEAKTANPTTSESDGSNEGTVVSATQSVFDRLTEERGDESSDHEQPAAAQPTSTDDMDAGETPKAAVASGSDTPHAAAIDARVSALSGSGPAAALPRLAEFEAARASLASGTYANAPDSDTPDRIVHSLRMQFQRGGGDAIVHIKPEHLGPLTISLRVENGSVSAHVNAENPVTAEWLRANEQTLREGLKSNGLQLERLVVNRDPDPTGRSPQREESQARREQRRRFNERRSSTFEITV